MSRATAYLIAFKLLALTAILIAFCCCSNRLAGYHISTKYHRGRCSCYYDGECWNKLNLDNKWVIGKDGYPKKLTRRERIREILDKAYKIMLESPPDAPHSAIWLVYCRLRFEIGETAQQKLPMGLKPRSR